jgi:hypothetical protein
MDYKTLDYIATRLAIINTPENAHELRTLIDILQMEIEDDLERIENQMMMEAA